MLKYWRIWLLLVVVLGAVLAIGLKAYPYGRTGVEIVYVADTSPAKGILEQGMIITAINGKSIQDMAEWDVTTKNLTGDVRLTANAKEYTFFINETLGIDVLDMAKTNLDFGLDLRGGTRIILKPVANATREITTQIIATLQTRANIYGLREMKFYPVGGPDGWYVQIEAAGIGSDIITDMLARQGQFEAKILKPVYVGDSFKLGKNSWDVAVQNNTVMISNLTLRPNQTFELDGITFRYLNKSQDKLLFSASAFSGSDIELVYTDPQHSAIMPKGGVWGFYFVVLISEKGASRFAKITTGIPSYMDMQTGEDYLDSKILLYIDNQLVSDLRIAATLGGQAIQTPAIQGTRATREDALEERLQLQTVLRSGALPAKLEVVSMSTISPTLGSGFFVSTVLAGALAAVIVILIVLFRYRSFKIALPMILIGLSEVIIILGIAATADWGIWAIVMAINFCIVVAAWWKKQEIDMYAIVGAVLIPLLGMMSWTIDLPAMGGIIAAIGTGVDHQIIIADETVKGRADKKIYTIKEKIKRAFFIIFGAAATTIAAMLPLMFLGIGLVRGFAIATIVGVLVGILITRPAYAKIIEGLIKK